MRDIAHLLRPGHLQQLRQHPRRPRGVGQRPLRGPRPAARTPTSRPAACCPMCQDTGTAIVMGKKGQFVFTGGGDEAAIARGIFETYQTANLRYSQMAPLDHVGRGQHRHQPAGPDRDLRRRRRRLQVPVHGQGRRLGQQELPVPGDQGAAQPDRPADVPRREAAHCSAPPPARRTTWPSSSAARRPSSPSRRPSSASARYLDRSRPRAPSSGHGFRDLELEAEILAPDPGASASAPSSAASTSATTCG